MHEARWSLGWIVLGSVLGVTACQRPGGPRAQGQTTTPAPAGSGSRRPLDAPEPGSSAPAASALHPALGGKPPSYWAEQGQKPVENSAPLPEEAWGRRLRYRAPVTGGLAKMCLCENISGDCVSHPIRGLSWAKIPWARSVYPGRREAYIEFVGVLSRDAFELVEAPKKPPPAEEPDVTRYPFPCGMPKEGERIRNRDRVKMEDEGAAFEYAEKQPDYSLSYVHWHPGLTMAEKNKGFSADKGGLVFLFTERLDEHRKRIESLWGGPMCVAKAAMTSELKSGINSRAVDLVRREGRRHGLLCGKFSGGTGAFPDRLIMTGMTWDRARLSRWLREELAGFPVEVESVLEAAPDATPAASSATP